MPLSELFHKLKTGERMSNGQKVKRSEERRVGKECTG